MTTAIPRMFKSSLSTFLVLLLAIAFTQPVRILAQEAQEAPAERDIRDDARFNALAWMQNSAEYRLLAEQTYRLALVQLHIAAKDPAWCADEVQFREGGFESKPPAVILDLDETVLDNSAYNARMMLEGMRFTNESWTAWCNEEKATLIPGAMDFIRGAEGMGVALFYVTNRDDPVRKATVANLKALGIEASEENVLTKNPDEGRGDDKVSRRGMVAASHRIVMLVGDSMSDLCSGMDEKDQSKRNQTAGAKTAMLGSRWIMMPNPVYGGWERALRSGNDAVDPRREMEGSKSPRQSR